MLIAESEIIDFAREAEIMHWNWFLYDIFMRPWKEYYIMAFLIHSLWQGEGDESEGVNKIDWACIRFVTQSISHFNA